MAAGTGSSASGSAAGRRTDALARWAARRACYLDNLKVVLIAAIIALHAVLGYLGASVTAVRQGWLVRVPDRMYRDSRATAVGAVAAATVFLSVVGTLGRIDDMMGGRQWPAVGFTVVETALSVFGPVWLLGVAQRHLAAPLRCAGPAVVRSAYGAFMVQTPALIGIAVALRPVPLPAKAKALIVAAGAVTASFWLSWLLISRLPGVARVL